jgi:large subunit ribosomal protein L17
MKHQIKGRKLNCAPAHRKALIRNQAIHLILHGKLITTVARVKEVRSFVEKLVTVARVGKEMNASRKATSMIPYSKPALKKLFEEIAPKYVTRPGGYTRIRLMSQRISDTAKIAHLSWVE